MQTIVESIKEKIEIVSHQIPEFRVFFNDWTSNDFNTLFASLSLEREYYAARVLGSFHGRVFPKASHHLTYSSCSLSWLSEVPKEVLDPLSLAWNKGKILYYGDKNEVLNAYSAQFAKDLDSFLKARAEELVFGGLMAFIHGCEPIEIRTSLKLVYHHSNFWDLVSWTWLRRKDGSDGIAVHGGPMAVDMKVV
ncbi:probable S-adenosylmethionine-dependent methyltransferase At5g37990 [Olea europaea subsp. europaea]|uniref:Probable S-adenosylmethionine-dependent methyltransferase At5g37990 n=1 Tax=Olea europaea subsp. europaea TaxID=158383 RepID=A0A8S0VJH3_OLEEU|nr:probable S-adenosylmethionine-dependent methyltransferase At5g37990 [Olea europaea subsp. europaea]